MLYGRLKRDGVLGVSVRAWAVVGLWTAIVGAAACGGAVSADPSGSGYTNENVPDGGGSTVSGLPCDIAAVIGNYCVSCHGNPPSANAPMSLLSYADLVAPSAADPSKSYAERSLMRMQDAASPMPPGAGVSVAAADIAAFQAWVDAGTPEGSCGDVDAGPDPFDVPAQCTSQHMWGHGSNGDYKDLMNPGRACNECHANPPPGGEDGGPIFSIAGTIYPTAHEPDECMAENMQALTIEITDANGNVVLNLHPNQNGTFTSMKHVATPYTARVVDGNGAERKMNNPQTSGDCNSCHTQYGKNNAPGRIIPP